MGKVDKIVEQNRQGKVINLSEPLKQQGGEKIPGAMRKQLEAAFDQDLSNIRVHRDDETDKLLEELGADAFTQGEHIYMTNGGLKIDTLAHEVAHVMQQKSGTELSGKKGMIKK